MAFSDFIEAVKIARERKQEKKKAQAIQNTSDIMGVYAENAVRKFKSEYLVQSEHGKRMCSVMIDPYPDAIVIKNVWGFSKKEYLTEFEKVLGQKLEEQGFSNYSISENPFNAKYSATLKVKW